MSLTATKLEPFILFCVELRLGQCCEWIEKVRSGQVILLLTISRSVSQSWPRASNCVSWPYFSLEENSHIVFRQGGRDCHIQGWQSLSVSFVCSYYDVYVYPVLILLLLLLLSSSSSSSSSSYRHYQYYYQHYYVHARPVSPGNAQHIMPTLYTYCSLDTRTPPSSSILYFLRWASFLPMFGTFTFSWEPNFGLLNTRPRETK